MSTSCAFVTGLSLVNGTRSTLGYSSLYVQLYNLLYCLSVSDMAMGWVDPWVGLGWVEFGQI